MVRLLLLQSVNQGKQRDRFNPTMVRLLHSNGAPDGGVAVVFQSHNGAIAACLYATNGSRLLQFQSHNGAIAALNLSTASMMTVSFNPTMVRLLRRSNRAVVRAS